MRWWQVALVALCFVALGVSIAERVRLLRLMAQPAAFPLPPDRQPTEGEQALRLRSAADRARAMGSARTGADFALLVGVGPLFGGLLWAAFRGRRTAGGSAPFEGVPTRPGGRPDPKGRYEG